MTQYLDRHGTEVRPGDTYAVNGDSEIQHKAAASWFVEGAIASGAFAKDVVLSRADGSPVYRYKGGEDVRVGDEYVYEKWKESDGTGTVDEGMLSALSNAEAWPKCTLLRRATPPVDERPLIGGDRNGTAVRRGDAVRDTRNGRTMRPCTFMPGGTGNDDWFIQELGPGMPVRYAELVTDEKAEPDTDMEIIRRAAERAGRMMDQIGETAIVADGTVGGTAAGNPPTILESLARTLSQPTRASRIAANYAKFHAAVEREVAREPSFSVVTDMSDAELMAFIKAPLVGEIRRYVLATVEHEYDHVAFSWVAEMRQMVDEEAGKRARGQGADGFVPLGPGANGTARFLRPKEFTK